MADTKISALTASTTPLAGTEVLPIVQSGVTKQVSVANLTAGRAISATELTLTTGNLIVSSGKGIDFSATSGTGTSELLADYEEGTWTPVVVGATTPGTGTYTTQVGRYTKIGNRVFFNLNLNWSAHTGAGDMSIAGLPFTSNSTSGNASSLSAWVSNLTLSALNILTPIVNTNSTSVSFFQTPAGGGAVGLVTLDTSAQVIISGHYEV
jgi:hypothetical protein